MQSTFFSSFNKIKVTKIFALANKCARRDAGTFTVSVAAITA